jgi:Holliday junction resolvase RusA-like endonuclease
VEDSDVARAKKLLAAFGSGLIESVVIPGAPHSKARPRVGPRGGYSDPKDKAAEMRTGWIMRSGIKQVRTGNVAICCIFYRPNRQRIDADNLLKHICDSGNGVLWTDDSQITAIMGIVEIDASNPRTVLVMGDHLSTLVRGAIS